MASTSSFESIRSSVRVGNTVKMVPESFAASALDSFGQQLQPSGLWRPATDGICSPAKDGLGRLFAPKGGLGLVSILQPLGLLPFGLGVVVVTEKGNLHLPPCPLPK